MRCEGRSPPMMTVLVADDNDGNREIMRVALESRGFRVVEARNGEEAIRLAFQENPRLFLIDIQMPVLDGYAVIKALRADERFESTPAVAVTAYAMQSDEEKAFQAGFSAHLSKPIDILTLRELAASLLNNP